MYYTESKILINENADKVYEIIKDVKLWPQIFKPCKEMEVLEEYANSCEIQLTAVTKGKTFKWKSKRIFDDGNRCVMFEQTKPANPLSFMAGKWQVKEYNNISIVYLYHKYDIKYKFFKNIISFVAKIFFIDANSNVELEGLKEYCEINKNIRRK